LNEHQFTTDFLRLKNSSGGHSPSVEMMRSALGFTPSIDACYLSNPFATDVVAELIQNQVDSGQLWNFLDRYPTPSRSLAPFLVDLARVPAGNLVVCNGVAEIIPHLLHRVSGTTLISVPTFSAYHEYAPGEVIFHKALETDPVLRKNAFIRRARETRPATAVVINPNNPDGFTYERDLLDELVAELSELCHQVIVDESFAGLVFPAPLESCAELSERHENVVVVRSLSKEFGIAGLRVGFAAMSSRDVDTAYHSGLLWNVNGAAELFLRSLPDMALAKRLEAARTAYLQACSLFIPQVGDLSSEPLPSRTNFALLKVPEGTSASILSAQLAFRSGIYVRSCEDKLGLSDSYLRVAARRPEENERVLIALSELLEATSVTEDANVHRQSTEPQPHGSCE
jgi:histidinol-phosphate/aromatic aminotransferase/cobyric acid decarboxylase-like protein